MFGVLGVVMVLVWGMCALRLRAGVPVSAR